MVVQDIDAYHKLLNDMQKKGVDTTSFENIFHEAINNYVGHYIGAYTKLITHFKYHAQTAAELEVLLHQFSGNNSPLVSLVTKVNENTIFDKKLDKYSFLMRISGHFEAFHKIKDFSFSPFGESSKESPLASYVNILSTFNDKIMMASQEGQDRSLDILGAQALAIYLKNQNSYMVMANTALDKINMPKSQREPFLNIFSIIYNLGMENIQVHLKKVWAESLSPLAMKVTHTFPMDLKSKESITPEQLTKLLAPHTGEFWKAFKEDFAQYLVEKNGVWVIRQVSGARSLKLGNILDQINQLAKISRTLWDKNAQPKPIKVMVSALPFKQDKIGSQYLQTTYFTVDGTSIVGVDNAPVDQDLTYSWWKKGNASVGYMLQNQTNYELSQQGYWALYKLMNLAQAKKNALTWNVKLDKANVPVRFEYKSDIFGLNKSV